MGTTGFKSIYFGCLLKSKTLFHLEIRVDFVDTEMQSPKQGDCDDQYLIVSGSVWNPGFHKLCGINPDQHFYLHLDKGQRKYMLREY